MFDYFLFVGFPYIAVALAVIVGIYRYFSDRYSYSSQSSQFLENRTLFWGSAPWHYGIISILLAHLLALLFPAQWAVILGAPVRLYVLEVTGLALALTTVVALGLLIVRRIRNPRVTTVTSPVDWVLLAMLLVQVSTGFLVALVYRWGADWYLRIAVPWLVSLFTLNPQIQYVAALPWLVKLHMLGGVLIIGVFPFTRLVHLITFPVTYLWRPYQVVVWLRDGRAAARSRKVGIASTGRQMAEPAVWERARGSALPPAKK